MKARSKRGFFFLNKKTILLTEISGEAFRAILQYLYSDDCKLNEENAVEVMCKAAEFQLVRLCEKAEQMLAHLMDSDNVEAIAELAQKFGRFDLEKICKRIIKIVK